MERKKHETERARSKDPQRKAAQEKVRRGKRKNKEDREKGRAS